MWRALFPKSDRAAVSVRPSLTLFFCLAGAFLLTLLPHVPQFPLWVSLLVVGAMVLRSVAEVRRWPLPSTNFCGGLALCLLVGIYLQFYTVVGRDAGTAFMAGLLAIKFFELRGPRDVALIIFANFFVAISSLLYSQAFELFVYCLIMMWVLTSLLFRTEMGDRHEDRLLSLLRASALIFFQALPLALFLFFFLPRYPGVLQVGMDDSSIGLTDMVKPGSISRLSSDDSTAMTVKFTGAGAEMIPPDSMYWRAIVLWKYEKGAWTPGDAASALPKDRRPKQAPETSLVNQEITIRPHFHHWLFALDYPVTEADHYTGSPGWSRMMNGGVLELVGDPLITKERYLVSSAAILAPEELTNEVRDAALDLPNEKDDQIDPRVRQFADQLQAANPTENEYIGAVLHYFRNGFIYSDTPGPGGPNALATFLFERKIGFCEHYASAFAVLMRLGGYPARLVVGYQGAQYNPYNNIYVVKQSNAHCWDEVWVAADKRWRRVDPTAVISSNANFTTQGAVGASGTQENLSIDVANHRYTLLSGAYMPSWMRRGILEMQLRREEVESDWDDWVFSYDPDTQNRWAQALGFGRQGAYVLALACLLAVVVSSVLLGFFMKPRRAVSPIEDFYAKFCRNMAQRGVPRAAWEGPLAYTERVAEAFPEKRPGIQQAGRLVAQARYAPHPEPSDRDELKSLLRTVTIPRSPVAARKS